MSAHVTNNAAGTLASSINDVELSLTLNSGQGALFPNPTGGDYFYVTLVTNANDKEIVKVTARSTNTLTIVRGQDGTTARAFTAGDRVELRFCAALHDTYAKQDDTNAFVGDQEITGNLKIKGTAGTDRYTEYASGADVRWRIGAEDTAESGSDVGSDFEIRAYGDDELLNSVVLKFSRANGIGEVLAGFKIGANKADAFAAATSWAFRQAATPAGWTKVTTYDNSAMRVVAGTQSQKADSGKGLTQLLTGRQIARANLPNVTLSVSGTAASNGEHSHTYTRTTFPNPSPTGSGGGAMSRGDTQSDNTGSSGAHTHSVSGATESINGGVTQTDFDLAINYVDFCIFEKAA